MGVSTGDGRYCGGAEGGNDGVCGDYGHWSSNYSARPRCAHAQTQTHAVSHAT